MITCLNSLYCLFKFPYCSRVNDNAFSGQTSSIKVQLKRSECKLCSKKRGKHESKKPSVAKMPSRNPSANSISCWVSLLQERLPNLQPEDSCISHDIIRGEGEGWEFYALKIESLVFLLCFHVIHVCFWIIQSSNLHSKTILHSCFQDSFRCREEELKSKP